MIGIKKSLSAAGYIRQVVRKLSVDIGPRAPGSPAEREAALWIKKEFEAMGASGSDQPVRESVLHM